MEMKLLLSTFVLVFFAELGDKTQLAALAVSAGAKKPWTVFMGASAALLLSTLIAVLLGSAFSRLFRPYLLKGIAGVIFLVFGVVFIADAMRSAKAAPPAAGAELAPNVMARIVLEMAAEFEESAAADYARLAVSAEDPNLRVLFLALGEEDAGHLKQVRGLLREQPETGVKDLGRTPPELPLPSAITPQSDGRTIEAAMAHERSMAAFYGALAKSAPFPSLKAVFSRLAAEETGHLHRLERMVQHG